MLNEIKALNDVITSFQGLQDKTILEEKYPLFEEM
jgi:hypothetical protein